MWIYSYECGYWYGFPGVDTKSSIEHRRKNSHLLNDVCIKCFSIPHFGFVQYLFELWIWVYCYSLFNIWYLYLLNWCSVLFLCIDTIVEFAIQSESMITKSNDFWTDALKKRICLDGIVIVVVVWVDVSILFHFFLNSTFRKIETFIILTKMRERKNEKQHRWRISFLFHLMIN